MAALFFDGLNKGRYVELTGDGTKARRQLGFCDGVVVSASHIKPGELVAVEILETQPGWSGDLRVGFTLLPDEALHPLPSFAIPELVTRGHSWIFPVGNAASLLASHRRRAFWRRQQQHQHQRRSSRTTDSLSVVVCNNDGSPTGRADTAGHGDHARPDSDIPTLQRIHLSPASRCTCCLYTSFGRVALRRLLPKDGVYLRPPDVEKGSIVAIYYELEACSPKPAYGHSSALAEYFQWPAMPTSDEEFNATHGHRESGNASELESTHQTPLLTQSTDGSVDPLCFQVIFHIVINGIDLITLSEQINLRRDQLCLTPILSSSLDRENTQNPVVTYAPKMRAVLDVYGQTKAVQLLPLHQEPVPRLSRLSSCAILRHIVRIHAPKAAANGLLGCARSLAANSSTESSPGTSSKRSKSSLPSATGWSSSTATGSDEGYVPWSSQSSFGRLMDNHRCRMLFTVLNQLPLPPSIRRELHLDACAIVWRELIE